MSDPLEDARDIIASRRARAANLARAIEKRDLAISADLSGQTFIATDGTDCPPAPRTDDAGAHGRAIYTLDRLFAFPQGMRGQLDLDHHEPEGS